MPSDPPASYSVRDPGDAWVEGPDGRKFWGRFGAAGLLVHEPDYGILLQHRVEWSHFGGTWGLPGGARNEHESAVRGALREANEEAGVPESALEKRFMSILDLGFWSYATLVTRAKEFFEPSIGDRESVDLRWVPTDAVADFPLHPGFAAAWPALLADLDRRLVLVVDAANVVGSRPDGWWKDRRGAAERLGAQLVALTEHGIASESLGLPHNFWWPEIVLVVEGQAASARLPDDSPVRVVRARGLGDDTIVDAVRELRAADAASEILTVTSDRELRDRVTALGATVRGAGWLLDLL